MVPNVQANRLNRTHRREKGFIPAKGHTFVAPEEPNDPGGQLSQRHGLRNRITHKHRISYELRVALACIPRSHQGEGEGRGMEAGAVLHAEYLTSKTSKTLTGIACFPTQPESRTGRREPQRFRFLKGRSAARPSATSGVCESITGPRVRFPGAPPARFLRR